MKKISIFLVLALVIGIVPVWAIDAPVDEHLAKMADNESYTAKVPGMLAKGLYEVGEAPLETLNQPFSQTVEKKNFKTGLLKGINDGSYNFLEGMTRGIFNILRAFAPGMGRYEKKDHQKKMLPGLAS